MDSMTTNNCTTNRILYIRNKLLYESDCSTDDIQFLFDNKIITDYDGDNFTNTIAILKKYLELNCNHNWIDDWFDVDVERSQYIVYCSVCETIDRSSDRPINRPTDQALLPPLSDRNVN